VGGHAVSEIEFNALYQLRSLLTNSSDANEYITQSEMLYSQLFHQSPDLFATTNLSFAHLNQLLMRLLTPITEPKFGLFGVKEVPVKESIPILQVPLENISFLTMETAPNAEPIDEIVKQVEATVVDEGKNKKRNRKKYRKPSPTKVSAAPIAVE
jgi:hypothetical protein